MLKAIIITHGLLAITGCVLLISYYSESMERKSLHFVVTLFGFVLMYKGIAGKIITKWLQCLWLLQLSDSAFCACLHGNNKN